MTPGAEVSSLPRESFSLRFDSESSELVVGFRLQFFQEGMVSDNMAKFLKMRPYNISQMIHTFF